MAQKVKGGQYQYGSAARNYYEVAPERIPTSAPSRRHKKAPETETRLDKAFVFKLSICGVLLFASSLFYISCYATYNTKQSEQRSITNEIRETQSAISLTEAKRSEKLNSDYIRERATNELGMSLPKAHQVVYIELPKESYTVYNQ